MSEADERLPAGPPGAQGEQGERGERGLPWRVAKAIVVLFFTPLFLALFAIFWINHETTAQSAAQRQQAEMFERKLCTTLDSLAARQPPPGPPADLSRGYLEWQYGVLAELGPDVGCAPASPGHH